MSKIEQPVEDEKVVSIGTLFEYKPPTVTIGRLFEYGPTIGTLDFPTPKVEIGVIEIPVKGEVVE